MQGLKTHHVIDIPKPGGLDALVWTEQPIPRPAHGEVLVRVHAAGVNAADCKQREGVYDMPVDAGTVPGLEIAGEVAACGPGTSRFKPGDRVCALVIDGGYAEYCVAPEVQCLPVPEGVDMVQAAGLPEAVFTVWMGVFDQARLAAGETVLVHGGGSGIGTTAIQMAKAAGARVFATAGGAAKCGRCVELGAELAVDHRTQDFGRVLGDKLGSASIDVVLDIVGAPYLDRNLELLAIEGRLCYLAGDGGRMLQLNLAQVLKKRLHITGGSLRRRPIAEKAKLAATIERRAWPWVRSGAVRPQVGLVVPLEEAAKAHEALQQRRVTGKVILVTEACERRA